jgi:polysaccharide biosynthesis protein PslG
MSSSGGENQTGSDFWNSNRRMPRHILMTVLVVCAATRLLGLGQTSSHARTKPVSFAILEDYDKGDDLGDVAADIALFKELEIRTWRGSIGWDDYEPSRGKYDFAWLHDFVKLAARHDITLRPYLGYTPEWAARRGGKDSDVWNNPPARVKDWERFANTVAGALRAHSNVASYEIYNEENVPQWWDGTATEYAATLRNGSRSVRSAHPNATVVFGGLVFPDREWIETVCEAPGTGQSFDILPFHAYPETWTPPGVTVENYLGGVEAFIAAADARCGRKPIWINETGFATLPGKSERDQAHWWVRAVATFLAIPRVEHIGVYEIKDLPTDRPVIGDAPNYHLGLARTDRTRKLAFHTVDLLTDLLDVGTLSVDDADLHVSVVDGTAGELHHHLFGRPDGDRVLIVWDRAADPTISVRVVPHVATFIVEYEMDGRPLTSDLKAPSLTALKLTPGVPRIFRLGREPVR